MAVKRRLPAKHQASSWTKPCSILFGITLISLLYGFFIVYVSHTSIDQVMPYFRSYGKLISIDVSQPFPTIATTISPKDEQAVPVITPTNAPVTVKSIRTANPSPIIFEQKHELYEQCPGIKYPEAQALLPFKKTKGSFDMHFIHVPKCGGTSMTAILREIACKMDPNRNTDCCTNPGFCDWWTFQRCASIRGCTSHIPQRPWIFKPLPSITLLRDPTSR